MATELEEAIAVEISHCRRDGLQDAEDFAKRIAKVVRSEQRKKRKELWMRPPHGGPHEQISDHHHDVERRKEFLKTYLSAGWNDPKFMKGAE